MGTETRKIQIDYTEDTAVGPHKDALYYPLDAYLAGDIKEEDIQAEKARRVANWEKAVRTPVEEVVLTEEEQLERAQAELDALTQQKQDISEREANLLAVVEVTQVKVNEKLRILEESLRDWKEIAEELTEG